MRVVEIDAKSFSRIFVVGDLFGDFASLNKILAEVGFKTRCDLLVLIGNIMGYTMSSREAVSWLSKPWVRSVAGINDLAVLARLNGLPALSLSGQWLPHCPDSVKQSLKSTLDTLPLALEINFESGVVPISSRPLLPGAHWSKFKDVIISRDGHPMDMLRSFDGKLPGLQAAGILPIKECSVNPDVILSISGLQLELPRFTYSNIGNRYIMLASTQMNHGPLYERPCVMPYLELHSLVKSIDGKEKCQAGSITTNKTQLKKSFCTKMS